MLKYLVNLTGTKTEHGWFTGRRTYQLQHYADVYATNPEEAVHLASKEFSKKDKPETIYPTSVHVKDDTKYHKVTATFQVDYDVTEYRGTNYSNPETATKRMFTTVYNYLPSVSKEAVVDASVPILVKGIAGLKNYTYVSHKIEQ